MAEEAVMAVFKASLITISIKKPGGKTETLADVPLSTTIGQLEEKYLQGWLELSGCEESGHTVWFLHKSRALASEGTLKEVSEEAV